MSSNLQFNTCGAFTMRQDCHLCDSPTQLYVPQLRRASHRPMHFNTDGHEVKRSSSPVAHPPSRQSWMETRKMAVTLGELEELYRANNKNRHGTWKAAAAQDETDTIKEECRWLTEQRDTLGKKVEELQNQLKEERKKNARSPSITFSLQTEADTTRMSGQQLLTALKEENVAIKKQKKAMEKSLRDTQNNAIQSKHQERILQEKYRDAKQENKRLKEKNLQDQQNIEHLTHLLNITRIAKETAENNAAAIEEALKQAENDIEELMRQISTYKKENKQHNDYHLETQTNTNPNGKNTPKPLSQTQENDDYTTVTHLENNKIKKENQPTVEESQKEKEENTTSFKEKDDATKAKNHLQKERDDAVAENAVLQKERDDAVAENAVLQKGEG
ncbi:hypothetical protein TCSYLVIO_005356 [Trypanosoma cruzi]|nr:hypothetical protein TCSYLVIO_005356 [Trypanosoma cruzi]